MLTKFFVNWFFLYPFVNRFKLWGVLIAIEKFGRRSAVHGFITALMLQFFAAGVFGAFELPMRMLRDLGMPVWMHVVTFVLYSFPVMGIFGLGLDAAFAGLRAPNQPILGNLFWSQRHQDRWDAKMLWLEEQRDGNNRE